ncbi:hypothetical protein [Gottfriedia luciferensis]|uniref:hypothetical protein n=1 Tax=Gottfriedia luciferensis TaxID=178774 RepID=UPI00115507CB|nr:hypothetical protein [Gottfriedia luciferensis]
MSKRNVSVVNTRNVNAVNASVFAAKTSVIAVNVSVSGLNSSVSAIVAVILGSISRIRSILITAYRLPYLLYR